jgi:hypothetical protein
MARTLTDCKIELRGAEDVRKRQEEEAKKRLADTNGGNLNGIRSGSSLLDVPLGQIEQRLARRAAIEQEKARVQTVKVEVQTVVGEGEDASATTVLLPTVRDTSGSAVTPSATMSLTLTPLHNISNGQEAAAMGPATGTTALPNGRAADDSQLNAEGGEKAAMVAAVGSGKSGGSSGASARSYKTSRFLF